MSLFDDVNKATRAGISGATSLIDTAKESLNRAQGNLMSSNREESALKSGTILQEERLFTLRPRSTPLSNLNQYTTDRGPFASIKLITDRRKQDVLSQTAASLDRSTGQALDYVVERLLHEDGYSDSLLTGITTSLDEKVQINEVFGDAEVVYYFGKSPVVFNLEGILTDDVDNNWFYNFIVAYGTVLRGSQLARNYQLVQINLPNMVLVGSISGLRYRQDASRDIEVPFQMSVIVKSMTPRPVSIPTEILTSKAMTINMDKLDSASRFFEKIEINSLKRKFDTATAQLGSSLGNSEVGKFFGGITDTVSGVMKDVGSFFEDATSGLFSIAELRANVFSPVYGVLTTLTKVVKSLTGDLSALLGGASNPLLSVLKDIRTISNEALALVNAVEDGFSSLVSDLEKSGNDIRNTIRALENTAGAISRAPEDLSNILKRVTKLGRKKGHIAMLKSGRVPRAKTALLNSGKAYSSESGAQIDGR